MFSPVTSLRQTSITLRPDRAVTFFSDVHLGYGSRADDAERERLLVKFLLRAASDSDHIVIAGDLFDVWFDYRHVIPSHHVRTLAVLADVVRGGIGVTYLMGNHDFGHRSYFRDELGIFVDSGDVDLTINQRRIYVSHGDGKAQNDTGYLILRSLLRSRWAQTLYRWVHPSLGIALASSTSHGSRDYTGQKDYGPHDGLRDFAEQRLNEGYDYVVMGHRHRACEERIGSGTYVNLGHWLDNHPTFARYDDTTGLVLHRVNDYVG